MANDLIVSKEQFLKMGTTVLDTLKPFAEETAERAARDMVHRILDIDNHDLRRRIEDAIKVVVKESVAEHLSISVSWK